MISAQKLWRKPLTNDAFYCEYIINRRYLRQCLPLSRSTDYFLLTVFELVPEERATIPQFRGHVSNTRSFFMSESEMASAKDACADAIWACERTSEMSKKREDLESFVEVFKQAKIKRPSPLRNIITIPIEPVPRPNALSGTPGESDTDGSAEVITPVDESFVEDPVEAPVERRSSWAKNINVAAILRWRTEVSPLDDEYEE